MQNKIEDSIENNSVLQNESQLQEVDQKEQERRKKQADAFQKYIENTGISMAFQIILAEIQSNKIKSENVYSYVAMRLRQIGTDIQNFQGKGAAK